MAIELSNIAFTNQADVIPAFGVEDIVNTGSANTLAGNDEITGTGTEYNLIGEPTGDGTGFYNIGTGFYNIGTLNTANGNDIITGIHSPTDPYNSIGLDVKSYGILHEAGTIDTGNGNDIITGISEAIIDDGTAFTGFGIYIGSNSTLDTGKGNDIITARGRYFGILNYGIVHTDDGNDLITGTSGEGLSSSVHNLGVINTGDGNDTITGTPTGTAWIEVGIYNADTIDTGNGNDTIIGIGARSGIENYGTINTGDGKDSIITDGGFNGAGNVFLGNGKDYLKGFGSGNCNGGNGQDTLELTSGSYTIGISGTAVNFTNGSTIMNTSEFEELLAGSITYNFSSLTNGQTIFVA